MADPSETTQVSREPADSESEQLLAAVRALTAQVGGLQEELQSLRAQPRSLPIPDDDRPGWDDRIPAQRESAAWVRSLDTPRLRRAAIPWLALEIAFLVGVAVLAVVAELSAAAVIVVMVGAWLLVALAEWISARAERRDDALVYRTMASGVRGPSQDPAWLDPRFEGTSLEIAGAREATTTRLPPPQPE